MMVELVDKTWIKFYRKLANRLLDFREQRDQLINNIKRVYELAEMKLPTLERDNNIMDIDPFTVFSLFNKSSMRVSNKIKIAKYLAEILNVEADIPTSFESIPTVNNMGATFYYFVGDREEDDIDELWSLFEAALNYSNENNEYRANQFIHYFDRVISKKGIGNSKLTSGLYWISPQTYVNLDKRSIWYIYESGKIPNELTNQMPKFTYYLSGKDYLNIIKILNDYLFNAQKELIDFVDFSYEVWRYSEEIKKQKKESSIKEVETTDADKDIESKDYWIFSPGSQGVNWELFYEKGIMSIEWNEIGDFSIYSNKEEINSKLQEVHANDRNYTNITNAIWQFTNEMKIGDTVYAKRGQNTILGWGIVTSDYVYNSDSQFKSIRYIEWQNKGIWPIFIKPANKTLTKITPYNEFVKKLNLLFEQDDVEKIETPDTVYPIYTDYDFLNEVFIESDDYFKLVQLIKMKKNVILQCPPGVGKTFAAKRLAYSMMGCKDKERVKMIQFHQSYSYEDFIMGFRPTEKGFELRNGTFYNFCKQAEIDSENDYFFIIDEINRGNLSKIFGELFMLIENDKRGSELELLYADEKFSVPKNLYIIGMMNTADRSLAILDYALRRRFAFYNMMASFTTKGFRSYQEMLGNEKFDSLVQCIQNLNAEIMVDDTLGEGFVIGHSYFCNLVNTTDDVLSNIVEYEILPLLNEYWFDEQSKVDLWAEKLRDSIK